MIDWQNWESGYGCDRRIPIKDSNEQFVSQTIEIAETCYWTTSFLYTENGKSYRKLGCTKTSTFADAKNAAIKHLENLNV